MPAPIVASPKSRPQVLCCGEATHLPLATPGQAAMCRRLGRTLVEALAEALNGASSRPVTPRNPRHCRSRRQGVALARGLGRVDGQSRRPRVRRVRRDRSCPESSSLVGGLVAQITAASSPNAERRADRRSAGPMCSWSSARPGLPLDNSWSASREINASFRVRTHAQGPRGPGPLQGELKAARIRHAPMRAKTTNTV